jgi:iron complex outermembrane receptor protein
MVLFSVLVVKADITDTLHAIPELEIQASRLNYYLIGASVQKIDSITLSNYEILSLAELLNQKSSLAVNSYGPGGLAGISIRGGAAHHASVIWNGINIQSPMHGGVNFSTLPVCFVDEAQIQYGGASTLFGSGNATGSLHMAENLVFNHGIQGEISGFGGSAGNFIQSGRILISKKSWVSSLKFFTQQNKNNFRFQNTEKINKPYERLQHAGYKQLGIAQANKMMIGKHAWIGTNVWLLDFHKDLPVLMSDNGTSEVTQNDRNIMYSAYYRYAVNRLQFKFQTGGFYNEVVYHDPELELSNNNHSFSLINIAELTSTFFHQVDIGIILEQKHEKARSGSYQEPVTRNILSPILSLRYHRKPIVTSLNIRKEFVDGKFIPLVFSAGLDLTLIKGFSLKSQISKNYSLPTMNDLYWENDGQVTGNPDLLPETGWSYEGGLYFEQDNNNTMIHSSLVLFHNQISDWIRWVQDSNKIWIPLNLKKGRSRGIEAVAGIRSNLQPFKYVLDARYSFTRAVSLEAGETQMTDGDQLLYVPKHKVNLTLGWGFGSIYMEYSQIFVSERTFDNAQGTLEPYTLGNVLLKSGLPLKSIDLEFYFSASNIWNTRYQVKHAYAMPLRQFMGGIKILFK